MGSGLTLGHHHSGWHTAKPVLPGRVGGRRYILFVRFWVRVPVQVVPTVLYRTILYCTVPFCTVTVWIYRYRSGTVPYWYRYWYWYLVPVLYPVVYLLYVPVRYCTVLCFDQYGTVPTVPVPINWSCNTLHSLETTSDRITTPIRYRLLIVAQPYDCVVCLSI